VVGVVVVCRAAMPIQYLKLGFLDRLATAVARSLPKFLPLGDEGVPD
jgi:hypothetical protein